jgi:hypothetical protein
MSQVKTAAPLEVQELPRDVRDAIDMYVPRGIPAHSAHYYIQAEHVRLLRGRAQAERNAERWQRPIMELQKGLPDFSVKDSTNYVLDNCYQADVLLHPGYELSDDPADLLPSLRNGVRIASLFASFLAPAWWMGVRRVTRNGHGGTKSQWEFPAKAPAQKVRMVADEVLGTLGWLRLSNEQVRQPIADLDLQCVPEGKACVGHVLFSELLQFP